MEFILLFPMLIYMFFGTFDLGFYMYALVSVENAARAAALDASTILIQTTGTNTAASSAALSAACTDVLADLNLMPNAGSLPTTCNALPLQVTAQPVIAGPDGKPAWKVTVSYQTLQMIPIPGLSGQLTITRVVQMRVRS